MALVSVRQPGDRDSHAVRLAAAAHQPLRPTPAEDRRAGDARRLPGSVRPRLRLLQRGDEVMDEPDHDRRARGVRRPAHPVRRDRVPGRASAAAICTSSPTGPAVAPTPRSCSPGPACSRCSCSSPYFIAADPRTLAAHHRPRVPADDRPHRALLDDRADPTAAPHRRQAAHRHRHGARRGVDVPAHPSDPGIGLRRWRAALVAHPRSRDGAHLRPRVRDRHAGGSRATRPGSPQRW